MISAGRPNLTRRACRALLFCALLAACSHPPLEALSPDAVILAFGDSLTHGTGVAEKDSYPAQLQLLSGHRVIRSGVPGEVSSEGLKRLRGVLDETRPALVIICHGGNDVLRRLPSSATEKNLRAMVELARSYQAQVLLVAVPRLGLFPEPYDFYTTLEEELQVPVEMDIVSDLETNRAMKSDQVHFNSTGYRRMAEAIQAALSEAGAL